MARVSVVIPCFNHGRHVDEAVESMLHQTYQDLEIAVVDDGSTERYTRQLLAEYAKPKTKVIRTENRGPSAARNTGIRETAGEYILTLDADDTFGPSFIERAVAILDQSPEVGVVSCWIQAFGARKDIRRPTGGGIVEAFACHVSCGCALFRRKCWEEAGGYDEGIKIGYEDWDFWISVTEHGWLIQVIPEVLFNYRVARGSRHDSCVNDHLDHTAHIVRKHEQALREHAVEVLLAKEHELQKAERLLYSVYGSARYKIGGLFTKPFAQLCAVARRLVSGSED